MALQLYNTMSSRVEEFHPLNDSEVRMYACGPTVYDYGHIGNFRKKISAAWWTGRESMWTNTRKTAPAISPCGRRRNLGKLHGTAPSVRDGRAGTWSAP